MAKVWMSLLVRAINVGALATDMWLMLRCVQNRLGNGVRLIDCSLQIVFFFVVVVVVVAVDVASKILGAVTNDMSEIEMLKPECFIGKEFVEFQQWIETKLLY